MADRNKTETNRGKVQAGTFGNASVAHATRNVNGAAAGDVVHFLRIPRGSVLYDGMVLKNVTAGAAGSTAKVGLIAATDGAKGDDDFFDASVALDGGATLNRKDVAAGPIYLDDDDYYVVATIGATGPGAADVELTVVANYAFAGNL